MCCTEIIILDLLGCRSLDGLHQQIKAAFDFPDYYGENWDAFYDLLSCNDNAQKVDLMGTGELPDEFKDNISIMLRILEDNKRLQTEVGVEFDYEIIS